MFENEAKEKVKRKIYNFIVSDLGVSQIITGQTCETVEGMPHFYQYSLEKMWQEGAEFGYNKANEWHFVKDGDYPKKKGIYLVAWKRTHHVEEYGEWGFDVDVFNADDGYFEGCGDFVIAWKGIVLPKEN